MTECFELLIIKGFWLETINISRSTFGFRELTDDCPGGEVVPESTNMPALVKLLAKELEMP